MTFNVSYDVPLPLEVYDALHAAITEVQAGQGGGLLVHIGRPTGSGFEIIEVWESKADYERFVAETMPLVMAKLPGAGDMPAPPPAEFDLCGLSIYDTHNVLI